jgi:SHS2 domain-containing protein
MQIDELRFRFEFGVSGCRIYPTGSAMKPFETFEHKADMGIRGFGRTVEEAFENGARALFSVMVDVDSVEAKTRQEIECSAGDVEALFVEWLNRLLSEADMAGLVFSKFGVKIDNGKLTGWAMGEKLNQEKHKPIVEVKAATYHMLKVERADDGFLAQCVVDV